MNSVQWSWKKRQFGSHCRNNENRMVMLRGWAQEKGATGPGRGQHPWQSSRRGVCTLTCVNRGCGAPPPPQHPPGRPCLPEGKTQCLKSEFVVSSIHRQQRDLFMSMQWELTIRCNAGELERERERKRRESPELDKEMDEAQLSLKGTAPYVLSAVTYSGTRSDKLEIKEGLHLGRTSLASCQTHSSELKTPV